MDSTMAYIVEQKIKGRIYLYNVESYWDKAKKQPRQRRTYIGPKRNENKDKTKQIHSRLVSKGYGNVFLLRFLSDKLGLTEILKSLFPDSYQEILALAFYEIIEASALYLFPYWLDEHNLPRVKKMYSPDISKLCDILGRSQAQRVEFVQKWIEHLKPINGIFYDITSISSYSTNVDFIQWGYNRDKENLPQLNMGVTFCHNRSLPIYYNLYPGSIVDVTTLKNCVEYLKVFNLKDILFVLDKGFFSKANVLEMNNSKCKVSFVQPLPFSLKKVKTLIKKNKRLLADLSSAFKFNEEILHQYSNLWQVEESFRITKHDLKIRSAQADKFLEKGHRVKVELKLKGREKSHTMKALVGEKIKAFTELITYPHTTEANSNKQPGFVSTLITPTKK